MILVMTEAETAALLGKYSRAEISAVQLRRALGGVTYGDVLIQLAAHDLPLPRTPQAAGREQGAHRTCQSYAVSTVAKVSIILCSWIRRAPAWQLSKTEVCLFLLVRRSVDSKFQQYRSLIGNIK
jgi:hypothetical protein